MAAIGPEGERLVRYATVSHDGRHAGRGGLGAVLGAKRIKAVAVRSAAARAPLRHSAAVLKAARDLSRPLVRACHGEVPGARHAREPPLLQRDSPRLHAQLPGRGSSRRRRGLPPRSSHGAAPGGAQLSVRRVRSAASTYRRRRAARPCASSTRTSSRSARSAVPPTLMRCWRPALAATSSGWTPSSRAARSPGPWNAPSAV